MLLSRLLKKFSSLTSKKSQLEIEPEVNEDGVYEEVEGMRSEDDYDYMELPSSDLFIVRQVEKCKLSIHISGDVKAELLEVDGRTTTLGNEAYICHVLRSSSIRQILICGKLTNKMCTIAAEAYKCSSVRIEGARICCTSSWLSRLLRTATSVEMLNCSFLDDAQVISDEVFIENAQLLEINITGYLGMGYSFPLLTDRVLRFWTQQKQKYKIHLGAQTAFTSAGIQYLTQMLHPHSHCSLYLGRFSCSIQDLQLPRGFEISQHGQRFFIGSNNEKGINVTFDRIRTRCSVL